jgi:group I intron endonuclease
MCEHSSHYIYALIDPDSREIRYVGQTCNIKKRYSDHTERWSFVRRSTHRSHWLGSLQDRGARPIMLPLQTCSCDERNDAERWWILHLRSQGYSLTNATDGGDGLCGYTFSPETRAKISRAQKGNKKASGYVHTPEALRKMADASRGRKPSAENLAKRSAAMKGRYFSPEHRGRISQAKAGSRNALAKLNEDKVREIRRRRVEGESYDSLAADFGVHKERVKAVCNRRAWKHVA